MCARCDVRSRKVVRKGDAEGPLSGVGPSSVMTLPQLVIMPPFLDFKERYRPTHTPIPSPVPTAPSSLRSSLLCFRELRVLSSFFVRAIFRFGISAISSFCGGGALLQALTMCWDQPIYLAHGCNIILFIFIFKSNIIL
jgi:hypothetical protein